MITNRCDQLIQIITEQLAPTFRSETVGGECILITPFLYPDNTEISLYLSERDDDRVCITDAGEAADYAFVNGVSNAAVRDRVRKVAHRFSLEAEDDELLMTVSRSDLAKAVLDMVNGVQDIGYLVYKRSPIKRRERFQQEVESFLANRHRFYEREVALPGATGPRTFDYLVKGSGAKQLLLSAFEPMGARSALNHAKVVAFDYRDVQEATPATPPPPLAVVLDTRTPRAQAALTDEVRAILQGNVSYVIPWDERHRVEDLLAA